MRIVGNPPSGGKKPTTPTIGTATDGGTGTTVSVAFTPSTYIGKSTITYTATSSPGSLTASGSGSPLTVSGLTTGTAYTFTVAGTTAYGVASDSSAASNSVTPANPSSYESIATFTAGSTVSDFTFSSIPSTYKHLQIRGMALDAFTSTDVPLQIGIQFNSDTAANYSYHYLQGNGVPAVSAGNGTSSGQIFVQNAASTTRNNGSYLIFGGSVIDIIDYASTSKYKTLRAFAGSDKNLATSGSALGLSSGLWMSTSAISTIRIFSVANGFRIGSTFALYGIKG